MTRRTPQISGPSGDNPGRPYFKHSDDFFSYAEGRRDEARRAIADLGSENDALHEGIARRNADVQRQNELDTVQINARLDEIADWAKVEKAAEAAMAAAKDGTL